MPQPVFVLNGVLLRVLGACLVAGLCSRGSAADFGPLLEAAANEFAPVDDAELEAARRRLATSAIAVERKLVPGSQQGEAWKDYLKWRGLQPQLPEGAELSRPELLATYDRLTSGEPGLEHPEFQRTAAEIHRLLALGLIRRAKDQPAYFGRQTQLLGRSLQRDPTAADARVSRQIEQRLDLVVGLDRAPQLARALRRELAKPNLYATVSERLLQRLVLRPVSKVQPVDETILGTRVRGTGSTTGAVSLELLPASHAALLNLRLNGSTATSTAGVNGPVVIRSLGQTSFDGGKTIELTDEAFRLLGAQVDASTRSRTRSITKRGGGLGKNLIERIAHKKVNEKRGQANAIASRRAERRIAGEFDDEVVGLVRGARRQYDDAVRKPLRRRAASPRSLTFATTGDALHVTILQATPRQLGAPGPPPAAPAGDVTLRLHQSALNNLLDAMMGGVTIRRRSAETPIEVAALLPPRLREEIASLEPPERPEGVAYRPWAITLRRERPVSFEIRDGLIKLLVHAARIESGRATYDGWDLLIDLRVAAVDGAWRVEVVGELDVLPTSFDPGAPGARLGSRQRALRRNLAKQLTARLSRGGEPLRVELPPIDLGQLNKPGLHALAIQHVASDAGWLTVSLVSR